MSDELPLKDEFVVNASPLITGLKASPPWASRKKVRTDGRVAAWNLGRGETEVLSRSLGNSNRVAIIDDLAARKCAVSLAIRHIGTAGILVLASRFRLIPSLRSAFSQVRNAGLYLRDDLVERLILEKERR